MELQELTEKLQRSLCVDPQSVEDYTRLRQEGKEAAQGGDLERSLELFRQAYEIQPSSKLKNRIQRLQDAIRELAASQEQQQEDEEEEFVNVNNSGLMLYKELYDKLYEHQKEGVAFLYSLHRDGHKGGILADDMGLGKTIQVISFLSGMYDAELSNHTLLVMPTSLIKNWVREFAKWTPGMRVKEFHGSSKAERNRNLERIQRKGGAIITTYQMLINNWEQLASYEGREFVWDYVILDEAHKIKTSSTKTAKCAHAIPAHHRLLLTGTPVQNNLREMWALFDFACQGSLLGTAKTFKTEYENPITKAREKDATPGEKALGLKISQNLTKLIQPYFLRRTKAEVQNRKQQQEWQREPKQEDEEEKANEEKENERPNAEKKFAEMPSLTRKNDLIVWTYLSPVQEDIYNQFISLDHIKQLLSTTRSPLAELTVLKKICDHPRLLSARAVIQLGLEEGGATSRHAAPEEEEEEKESEWTTSRIDHVPDNTLIDESGKLRFLVSLLEKLREEGHRTLIFSQSRKMLDIVERVLRNREFRLLRVDGTVTQLAEREKRIALFQTSRRYSVFLLTTQVGGVGITLTGANRVVIFDPSWNPTTDAQAVDRAYRIGQTENVIIYRLITCGTVEEKIFRRQVFKDSLIRQTTGDKKNPFRYFSKQELKELFRLEDTRSSSTQLQLQSLHGQQRRSDPGLDRHITQLHTMHMFGISDHDLLFSREAAADEDAPEDAEAHRYIQTRVQKAQELVQAESELHGQLMESVAHNTEPAWLRMPGRCERDKAGGERERCQRDSSVVDLTQSGSDQLTQSDEEQLGTSHPSKVEVEVLDEDGAEEDDEESIVVAGEMEMSSQPLEISNTAATSETSRNGEDVIVLEESEQSSPPPKVKVQHEDGNTLAHRSSQLPQSPALNQMDTYNSLQQEPQELSEASVMETEAFQGNFNLQLEDSADMFSCEEDVGEEETEERGESEFQLQMDVSADRPGDASHLEGGRSFVTSMEDVPAPKPSVLSTSAEESPLHFSKKKKAHVLYDSEEEEEEEEEAEKPSLASSPLAANFRSLGSSTPKSALSNGAPSRRSINLSVASRRSFVESMLEELEDEEEEHGAEEEEEDEEEEDDSSAAAGLSQASEANGISAYDSVAEEEEPSGETVHSEYEGVSEECEEEGEEEEEDQSAVEECSGDVELASGETLEHFAPKRSSDSEPCSHKDPEDAFRVLVHAGKRSLAEGRKQEALDLFLKAIDINSGDGEIQLLIIQLYRQLSAQKGGQS